MNKLFAILLAGTSALSLQAQNNPAVTQADNTRLQRETDMRGARPGDSLPSLYDEESADVGPQSVLRLKKAPWFRASADGQVFYTDNMLYAEEGKESAGVAVTTVEAAFMTKPCLTRWASYGLEAGYRHQFFNYFGNDDVLTVRSFPPRTYEASDFDFDSSTVFGTVSARTKHYSFSAGLDFTQLYGFEDLRDHDYDEFYSELTPRWSVQRNFRVCDRSMASLAYLGSYHLSREDQPIIDAGGSGVPSLSRNRSERWEHTFIASYTVALPHHFAAQPYYRFQLNDMVETHDVYTIHTLGLSAGWYPCANFSVRGFVGYNWSQAGNKQAVEYTKLDAGAGLTAVFRF